MPTNQLKLTSGHYADDPTGGGRRNKYRGTMVLVQQKVLAKALKHVLEEEGGGRIRRSGEEVRGGPERERGEAEGSGEKDGEGGER